MSGAAGCGYEFRNVGMSCCYLTRDLLSFNCEKYKEQLNKFPRTEEPIRLKKCADDAGKYWDSEYAKQLKLSKNSCYGIVQRQYIQPNNKE